MLTRWWLRPVKTQVRVGEHSLGQEITVTDLPAAAASAVYLANDREAEFVQEGTALTITLPAKPLSEYDTVVKVGFTRSIGE